MPNTRCRGVLCVPIWLGLASLAHAQVPPGWSPLPKDQDASAKAMVEAWTPGEPHARLAALAGRWCFTSKLWLTPASAPLVANGTATSAMQFRGRYLQTRIEGDLMGVGYEAVGVRAHDNTTGQYQSVWMDNISSMLLFMTGSYDAQTRTYTMHAEIADLADPPARVRVREVLTVVDANTHRVEMFETRGGETFRRLEFVYTRAQ